MRALPIPTRSSLLAALCASGLSFAASAAGDASREFAQVLRSRPNLEHGAELFRDCAACHGTDGGGSEDGDVPRIAGQHFNVLVRQLVDYRHETRWDIRMEHYAGRRLLSDPQAIADVASYASELDAHAPRGVGDGQYVSHGAAVYAARCAQCHGTSGQGNSQEVVPRLAGQHYEYLLRQMYDAVDGRRPNFSRAHVRLLARLERNDLVGVADFLARAEWSSPSAQVVRNP
ncbi:MAG TPA: c-type cytochrome [Steroidobacteraceae bacterium]